MTEHPDLSTSLEIPSFLSMIRVVEKLILHLLPFIEMGD
ncbi:hypothetical protein LEP1GSC043_1934 [Leptospira weilii str. Ecochallenge]|uniref:Uncharacterized protein n=1 Tax=Leptospira weilii str. Ecochallenge TaxID=1049986 RepID=N1UCG9_9LEPT|nr:hypothetical protein LEP1GSC043_1934 [Leptospira weilii str. Ecochallenge]